MTVRAGKHFGLIALCTLALVAASSAPAKLAATAAGSVPATETALPTLQGDAALAELARRGEKASLLAAFTAARYAAARPAGADATQSLPSLTGPIYLKASNPSPGARFGWSVAVSGATAVIGAVDEASLGGTRGAAYVFVRNGTTWSQQAYLKVSTPGAHPSFGFSVAVVGNTVAVGAPYADSQPGNLTGAVYVFVRSGTTWSQQVHLLGSVLRGGFGSSLALAGNTLVVGSPLQDEFENPTFFGTAYVFVRSGTTWSQEATLKPSSRSSLDRFGISLSMSGDTVVVGASGQEKAYVFVRHGTTWSEEAFLKVSSVNTKIGDGFGWSVSVSGNTVVVGAPDEAWSGAGPIGGAAYVFVRQGTTWSQQAHLEAPNPSLRDHCGAAVAVSGSNVVVGCRDEDGSGVGVDPAPNDALSNPGAAFVFVRSGTTWNLRSYLKATNPGGSPHSGWGDQFGAAVAVSGNTVLVGAFYEGTGVTVNPPTTAGVPESGAAYVFEVPSAFPLVHVDADTGGDVFLYEAATGSWSEQVNHAGGGFVQQTYGAWAPNWSLSPANFNGDGLTDLFLFNEGTGAWAKMRAETLAFTTESTGSWWPGWRRYVMDLDGDGVSDIFLYDPVTGQWFKCISSPTGFTYLQGTWSPGWELYPMTLDDDAIEDLFLFNRTTGRWFWVLGQSGAAFTYFLSGAWSPGWQLYPGDFNGDGSTDLLLYDSPTGAYFVATKTATGFTYSQAFWSPGWTPHVADFDGDLFDDLLLHNAVTGVWSKMMSDGSGAFTNASAGTWSGGSEPYFTDVNGDGRADILLYNPATGAWQVENTMSSGGTWATGLTIITRAPPR